MEDAKGRKKESSLNNFFGINFDNRIDFKMKEKCINNFGSQKMFKMERVCIVHIKMFKIDFYRNIQ